MKNIFKIFLVLGFFTALVAAGQINPFNIQFPIPQLGNCNSFDDCKLYCDNPANQQACVEWAKSQGVVVEEPSHDFSEKVGPGGCRNQEECDAYCDVRDHMDECLDFAVSDGFMTQEEADRIRRESKKRGPGGCQNHEECNAFCSNPDNFRTCLQFAVDEGKINQEEADFLMESGEKRKRHDDDYDRPRGPEGPGGPEIDEEKAKGLIEEIGGPGGCSTMEECENFCNQPKNDKICFEYAMEHGLVSEKEKEKFKKIMEEGGPGGCRGQEECDAFCSKPEHGEECMQFAIENDMMPLEEIERMKKMMEIDKMGGPGGCRGKEECDAYCSKPANGEECFEFSKKHGLMSPEEIQRMEKEREIIRKLEKGDMKGPGGCMGPKECDNYCSNPDHFQECMKFGTEKGFVPKEDIERKMRDFEKMKSMMIQMHDSSRMNQQGFGEMTQGGSEIKLKKSSSGQVDFVIMEMGGIKEFSFTPASGSSYSGGVSGCPKEFKSDSSFFGSAQYPVSAVITNCQDEKKEIMISSSEGSFGAGEESFAPENDFKKFEHMGPPLDYSDYNEEEKTEWKQEERYYDEGQKESFNEEYERRFEEEYRLREQEMMREHMTENVCDFNKDGKVDEYEAKECANTVKQPFLPEPVPMPIMPIEEIKCDFNRDGKVDEYESKECFVEFSDTNNVPPETVHETFPNETMEGSVEFKPEDQVFEDNSWTHEPDSIMEPEFIPQDEEFMKNEENIAPPEEEPISVSELILGTILTPFLELFR